MDGRMPDTARAQRALTIEEIAALTRAKPRAGDPLDRRISNIAPLDTAVAADISFLDKPKFLDALAVTRAGACFISPRFEAQAPPGLAVLVTPEPYRAFVAVTRALFPEALRPSSLFGVKGRSKDAHVHASARLEANVTVDPLAVIGADAEIGAGTVIAAGAVIGPGVSIGRDCAIGAGVTIQHALIGDRVIIHPGARIGQDGFGYLPTPQGHQKIPQTRRVIVQDDVEIGANSTIDRGATRDTVIGEGTKIDNLVQIGHNTSIGRHCLLAAQTGISGSVEGGGLRHDGRAGRHRRPFDHRRWRHACRALRRHLQCSRRRPLQRLAGAAGARLAARRRLAAPHGARRRQTRRRRRMSGDTLSAIDIGEILRLLPHRYPFVMIDRLIDMRADEHAIGIKNVTVNEPQFMGHFPDNPVMPGVLVIEGMAQTAGTLCLWHLGAAARGRKVYLLTIDKAKFRKPAIPGDTIEYHVDKIAHRRNMWWYRAKALVNGALIAEAEVGAMIAED